MIIGLSGYARSGKDEAAKGLETFGYMRVAFADKLREFLYRLNPTVEPRNHEAFSPHAKITTVQDVIDTYGWDKYKQSPYGPHIREYLQRLGTECGRELISDSIWIDAALGPIVRGPRIMIARPRVVVTDCRFPNEAKAIKDRGGYIVRINRPGVGPANSHPSETALDDWEFDHVIVNDGSIRDLHDWIANLALSFAL